jgi:hypothetical protein
VLPALLFLSALAPAVVFTLVVSIAGPDAGVPGHAGYYQIISIILLLFSAIMAPELLCPDRRDRVIDLYLVRPLTSTDYLAARWLAFLAVTLAIVYAGQFVLLAGFTLAAAEPLEHLREHWLDVPRFLLAGLVIAIFTTTLPMAVSAFTTRRAYAAAFVIALYLVAASSAGILTNCRDHGIGAEGGARVTAGEGADAQGGECDPVTGSNARWFALADIGQAPAHLNDLIFVDENDSRAVRLVAELPLAVPIGWYVLLTAGPGLALWRRYTVLGR